MKICFLTASVSRHAGGLYESVRGLAQGLELHGDTVIACAVEDSDTAADVSAWSPVEVRCVPLVGPERFSYSPRLLPGVVDTDSDILLSHGLWRYTSFVALWWHRRSRKPYIVNPHGMLDPWAVQNSRWRKRVASLLYEQGHLQYATVIRALCLEEAQAIREYGLQNPICVVPNGIDLPPASARQDDGAPASWQQVESFRDRKALLFLGRLHPKKNIPALLRAWAQVSRQGTGAGRDAWALIVAGWDELGHRAELEALASELGIEREVYFAGPLFGEQKEVALRAATAFVLPSLSEGLPMSVLEAWAYALPVLMTPQCNLQEGFAADAAIRAETDVASLAGALEVLFGATDAELGGMGLRGRALVEEKFSWVTVADEMRKVCKWALGGGPTPESIVI